MKPWMSLERTVATWMADEAAGTTAVAEQLSDQIITATGRQRPAPRWLALLQETSMSAQSRVVVGAPALRLGLVALLLLALAIAGVTVGAFLLNRQTTTLPLEWSGYRGGPAHEGVVMNGPVGKPVLRWQARMDPIDTFVALSGETILVTNAGVVRALDAATGLEQWAFETDLPLGEATVADGLAYAIDSSGVLHVIDIATGKEQSQWTVTTDARRLDEGLSPPTVAGDAIYVLAADGGVIALDRATGDHRWDVPIPNGLGTNVPSVADGLVYVGGEGFVAALDADDGDIVWNFPTDHEGPMGIIVVADGVAYAGDGGGPLLALDARTGESLGTVGEALFAPAVAGPIAVAGSQSGRVVGFDTATGNELWDYQMSGASRPASIADGVAYIASETGRRVYALDVESGEELWPFDINGDVMCCVGVGNGLVVVPTMSGSLYAIGGDGAAIKP